MKIRGYGKNGQSAETHALLNNGSTNSFCPASLFKKLDLQGQKTMLNSTSLRSQESRVKTTVNELEIMHL